jgi:hypothetical protein
MRGVGFIMRCFGEFEDDRLCDICELASPDTYIACKGDEHFKKLVKKRFRDCSKIHSYERHYRATDSWSGRDEDCTETIYNCTLTSKRCNPESKCAMYIKEENND